MHGLRIVKYAAPIHWENRGPLFHRPSSTLWRTGLPSLYGIAPVGKQRPTSGSWPRYSSKQLRPRKWMGRSIYDAACKLREIWKNQWEQLLDGIQKAKGNHGWTLQCSRTHAAIRNTLLTTAILDNAFTSINIHHRTHIPSCIPLQLPSYPAC